MHESLTVKVLRQLVHSPQAVFQLTESTGDSKRRVARCVATMHKDGRIAPHKEDGQPVTLTRTGMVGPSRVRVWAITKKGRASVA